MASRIVSALLSRGFFPKEIPPTFTSAMLAEKYSRIRKLELQRKQWTQPDPYNTPRARMGRRMTAVVNPIPFICLAQVISEHWREIRSLHEKSGISYSKPKFNSDRRSISDSDFDGFREAQVVKSAGYAYVMHADFSRFFPTIYTHAIEWAASSKEAAKSAIGKRRKNYEPHWGARLDELVRNMQDGQTQGLPIGPDTSYIIAELVASAIDRRTEVLLDTRLTGARIIDDYVLFFETRSEAEQAHSALARAAAEFQIDLNNEKTYIDEITGEGRDAWSYGIPEFTKQASTGEQRRAILRFTERVLNHFRVEQHSSIGRYAIKIMAKEIVHPRNIDVAIACILRLARISPNAISDVTSLIVSYVRLGFEINLDPIKRFIHGTLSRSLDLGFDKEVSWCLWAAGQLRIRMTNSLAGKISLSNSSIVVILGKILEVQRLSPRIRPSELGKNLRKEDFHGPHWLLAYEGCMQGWFGWGKDAIEGSILWPLAQTGVSFLHAEADLALMVKRKKQYVGDLDDINFADLDEYFEAEVELDAYEDAEIVEDEVDEEDIDEEDEEELDYDDGDIYF